MLTLEIVTPERKVFSGKADGVILPTESGQVNILAGHIPLTTLVKPGELIIQNGTDTEKFVIDKGFARILGDTVSILTEAAIDEEKIDLSMVENAEKRATTAIEAARTAKDIDPAEIEKMEQILRFAAVQRLIKKPSTHIER